MYIYKVLKMQIKIDIWSDYGCPFCYIGKKRLDGAISQFSEPDIISVQFRSFQLDPYAKGKLPATIDEVAKVRGMSVELIKKGQEQVANLALEMGLVLHYDTFINANSLDAHRLNHYAESKGKAIEMEERLMRAILSDGLDISDHNTLISLANEIGLNEVETTAVLNSSQYCNEVSDDIREARRLDITGVPLFVFNDKYSISGAQSEMVLLDMLNKILKEEQAVSGNMSSTGICTNDFCSF